MTTKKGYFGWAPRYYFDEPPTKQVVVQEDLICVVAGCSMPLIIRPYEEGYELIGECYVQGMMEGEALLDLEMRGLKVEEVILY